MPTDQAFWDLSAKVTALEIIVETLIVDQLAETRDPATIAEEIVKSSLATEEKVRSQFGENRLSMKVTETISSLFDRAAQRAVARGKGQRRSSPK